MPSLGLESGPHPMGSGRFQDFGHGFPHPGLAVRQNKYVSPKMGPKFLSSVVRGALSVNDFIYLWFFLVISSSASYLSSTTSFIFSFRNKDNLSPFKSNVYQNRGNAMYTHPTYGPTFGGGHDFQIPYNAKTSNGYSNFGHTYLPPSGYSYANTNTRNLLAGSYYFKPSEIEVYYFV